jgi:hypothetical protein
MNDRNYEGILALQACVIGDIKQEIAYFILGT